MRPQPRAAVLKQQISKNHLRFTRQRQEIFRAFTGMSRHVTAEEVYREVQKKDHRVGLSTIYRTLGLFCRFGLAEARQFGDGHTRYDPVYDKHHHDHLICTECGEITEFENRHIERLQEQVARRHRFVIRELKLELYGLCVDCHGRASGRK
ncbi:MAG TPA: transcriptional repressor, partial [Nitrospiria bacterium]|nr:transcriptional repressor [Nitrospiria bacterium]